MQDWVVGFDCGGSSTRAVVLALDGRVLGRGDAGPSNYLVVGIEAAVTAVGAAFTEAIRQAGGEERRCQVAFVAMAGAANSVDPALVQALRSLFPARKVQVDGDIMAAFTGAFPHGNGLVVIAGTGSVAFGLAAGGERVQVGGWGYLLGDEGSGYAVGLDALRTVLGFYDGREKATTLAPALLDHLALSSPAALVRRVYTDRMSRDDIAAIAPFVAAHAAAGDTAAVRILWNAGGALADLAAVGVERIIQSGIGANVALLGGLFAHIPMLTDAFHRHLRACLPDTKIVAPRFDAVGGAALLALREAGVDLTEPVLARLAESL